MLVGLCGYPNAGKSEVRDILIKEHGFKLLDTKIPLRLLAAEMTGLHEKDFVSQEDKAKTFEGVTRRQIMGELGNAIEKLWGDDWLLMRALQWARTEYPEGKIVVDALRKDQTRNFPGMVVQVIAERAAVPKYDFDHFYQGRTNAIIVNDGTQEDLEETVKRVLFL